MRNPKGNFKCNRNAIRKPQAALGAFAFRDKNLM